MCTPKPGYLSSGKTKGFTESKWPEWGPKELFHGHALFEVKQTAVVRCFTSPAGEAGIILGKQ